MFEIEKKRFGAFVAKLRKEKGYTQKELARQLPISDNLPVYKVREKYA